MSENPYACPNCKADSTQSIKMLFQTGIQHGTAQTSLAGVGLAGGGLGVGVGSASTSSSTSMALISKYALPPRPTVRVSRIIVGWICTVIGGLLGSIYLAIPKTESGDTGTGCLLFLAVVLLFPGLGLIFTYPSHKRGRIKQQTWWDGRTAYLSRTWVCFRCGHEWSPEA